MNPWEQLASQMAGTIGVPPPYQHVDYSLVSGNSIPYTMPTDNLYISNSMVEEPEVEEVKPPTEFEQLSNHKFHELLDKFNETL